MSNSLVLGLILAARLSATDPSCPAYPQAARQIHLEARRAEHQAKWQPGLNRRDRKVAVPSANFIDDHIFGKMAADGVEPAPLATDAAFLRRAMLDLTGRIPSPEQVEAFLAEENPAKRSQLIASLIGTPEFVDYWTLYFGNRFQVTGTYYDLIGIPGRTLFHTYLREFVGSDRPWNEVATDLITASGDTLLLAPGNFILRGIQRGNPIQDTWDTLANTITTEFLGVPTQCISCHDGRRHLEEINLYLLQRRRSDFMQLAAFFSRMNISELPAGPFGLLKRGVITDRTAGVYHGQVPPDTPGSRPPRIGAYEPVYLFNGEAPRSGLWRQEFARLMTSDRQFARSAVNYLWAHFFRIGIVDPPNAWDLARMDPRNPPPEPWTLQPSHPALIEALADFFISNGYRFRPLIRLLVESNAYQLSSQYPGPWKHDSTRYFAKHFPRRLSAEEIYDALISATLAEFPIYEDRAGVYVFAGKLPDAAVPNPPHPTGAFLRTLGRGDWWNIPRRAEGTVVQALTMMNDTIVHDRTLGPQTGAFTVNRVVRVLASAPNDEAAIRVLFLATLGRPPSEEEMATVIRNRNPNREQWFINLQWALLNRAEFVFNQ